MAIAHDAQGTSLINLAATFAMLNHEITFKDGRGNLTVITPGVMKALLRHRQIMPGNNEAAGVLIGERRGEHLVIQRISEPGRGDKRTIYSVDRCGPHHQALVDYAFLRSGGTLNYLGEWHTHPEDVPSPSTLDISSWTSSIFCNEPRILVIVGRKDLWVGKKVGREIIPLNKR